MNHHHALDGEHVSVRRYYGEWHGHPVGQLDVALHHLRSTEEGDRDILFLAGDSSLDNKYWILDSRPVSAVNGYEHFLRPSTQYRDVCYWLNRRLVETGNGHRAACLNTSVEATTLAERARSL